MMPSLPVDRAPDLAMLEEFLASDSSPPDCMQLSELDGFLAGIVSGPELIRPSEWLPHVWRTDDPVFADMAQATAILGSVMSRYNEIVHGLDARPPSYQPLLVERQDSTIDASDWTLGFLLAMSLRQDAWEPLTLIADGMLMLEPVMLIASTNDKANLTLDDDERLPDEEMAKLLADPGPLLALCVSGMRGFFRARQRVRKTRRKANKTSTRRRRKT